MEVLILRIQNNNLELKFEIQIKWLFKIWMNFFQSWNIKFHIHIKILQKKFNPFYNQLIIFWIERLIFGFENINLIFKYQFLDQIGLFELKWKYHIWILNLKFNFFKNNWNRKFQIQIFIMIFIIWRIYIRMHIIYM